MSRQDFPGQAAAARTFDNASAPEPDDFDPADALDAIAGRLIAADEVGALLDDLYSDGQTYPALDRLMCGRAKQFGDDRVLQALLRRLKSLDAGVDSETSA